MITISVRCHKLDHAFSILGKKWNAHIIHLLLDDNLRFSQINDAIPNISAKVLTARLSELEKENIVRKEGINKNGAYSLTEKGQGLSEVIKAVTIWSHDYVE